MKYNSEIDKIFLKLALCTTLASATVMLARCAEMAPAFKVEKSHLSDRDIEMIRIFKTYKSPHSIELGLAVNKTKYPKVLASIALVESNGDINAIGDAGKSKGAFQIQSRYWGPVPKTATEQATQAENILDGLLRSNPKAPLRLHIARYNGGNTPPKTSFEYADKVLQINRSIKR